MRRRVSALLAQRNTGALVADLVLIVVGILVAFQIDRWAEHRRDVALEQEYLARLSDDLALEIELMKDARRYAASRISAARFLERVVGDPAVAAEATNAVAIALETVSWRSYPLIEAFVYNELVSTGNLGLVRSNELRHGLTNHYVTLRHESRVGTERHLQQRYAELTAGILTIDELVSIEQRGGEDTWQAPDPSRQVEIAQALAARPDAIALLPGIAQQSEFVRRVLEREIRSTESLIEQIDTLLEGRDE